MWYSIIKLQILLKFYETNYLFSYVIQLPLYLVALSSFSCMQQILLKT